MAELQGTLGVASTPELRVNGVVVGITDRVYEITGPRVRFDEVLVRGDLSGGELEYNGRRLRIVRVDTAVGLLVGTGAPRGPVWQGVECEVID